jgi:hypothetical protein
MLAMMVGGNVEPAITRANWLIQNRRKFQLIVEKVILSAIVTLNQMDIGHVGLVSNRKGRSAGLDKLICPADLNLV